MKPHTWHCAICEVEMKRTVLPTYEYLEGTPIPRVPAYQCPRCHQVFLTEQQAKAVRNRTREIMERRFGFERRVTISGKSLAITIPQELAAHLGIRQGSKVKLMPVEREGFLVKAG